MHIPGRFCYLCNEREAKQNKTKDNRLPGFHVWSMYIECYVVVGSKIIIFVENLFPGLTGSTAENLFHSILPVTQLYSLVYQHFILFDWLKLKKASKLMFMPLFLLPYITCILVLICWETNFQKRTIFKLCDRFLLSQMDKALTY